MKLYVREVVRRTSDGDTLITIKTYESRPKRYNYLIWRD